MKTGFIGGGNMAAAILKGMIDRGLKDIFLSDPSADRRTYLQDHYGIETTPSNRTVVSLCPVIILAVKPQVMQEVLCEIGDDVTEEKTILSVAAGITLDYLSSHLKTRKIMRVMPNTPALVLEGMTVLTPCEFLSEGEFAAVEEIFQSIGRVIVLPERYLDAVTALSGSGPAFFALFIEALLESGLRMGLARSDAFTLIVQTAAGTAKLLESGLSPSEVIKMVASPGGTTEAGLRVFEEKGFQRTVLAAIEGAQKRAQELGSESSQRERKEK